MFEVENKLEEKINAKRNTGSNQTGFGFGKKKAGKQSQRIEMVEQRNFGVLGLAGLVKRKRDDNTEISCQPVRLTEAGKNPVLDILDPKVPVDTKVLQNAINGNKKTGKEGNIDNVFLKMGGEIRDKVIKKAGKGNNREKTAIEPGIVTKKGSVRVNGGKCGDDLRDEKQKQGKG